MKKFLSSIAIIVTITGCSSSGPYPTQEYRDDHSRAWNIVQAGDMAVGISDSKRPKDVSTDALYNSAFILSGFSSSIAGISGFAGGTFNLGFSLLSPKAQGARNTLLAWLPKDEAQTPEEARQVILSYATQAIKSSLDELGIKYVDGVKQTRLSQIVVNDYPEWNCSAEFACQFYAQVAEPVNGVTPSAMKTKSETTWFLSGNSSRDYSFIYAGHRKNTVDQIKLNGLISKYLPEFMYIYIAPHKVSDSEGNDLAFPYLLEKGKVELFIYPE